MVKRDPYNHQNRWLHWKQQTQDGIPDISDENSALIREFLSDMELGKNVSPVARKGERSYCRLLALKSRMIFFAQQLGSQPLNHLTKDQVHKLFSAMRNGTLRRKDSRPYAGVSSYVKDFKSFWSWLRRTGRVSEDITCDLSRSDNRKPPWVFLTYEQFRQLANQASTDYRALLWLMYDSGMRVTEAYSIRVCDFQDNFTRLIIRPEYAKTFGRTINLKLCPPFVRELARSHNLQPQDYIFIKEPAAFNKYLRQLAKRVLGTSETAARKPYHKMRLYDIRHNACCFWLNRYQKTRGLMYRMGWSEEKEIRYYSEFLGLADTIDDEDMITAEEKTHYEKRIARLENDRDQTLARITDMAQTILQIQQKLQPVQKRMKVLSKARTKGIPDQYRPSWHVDV